MVPQRACPLKGLRPLRGAGIFAHVLGPLIEPCVCGHGFGGGSGGTGAGLNVIGPIGGGGLSGNVAKNVPTSGKVIDHGLTKKGLVPALGTRLIPQGVPSDWRIKPSKTGGGVQYYNPKKSQMKAYV
jgi:hypothetical protein